MRSLAKFLLWYLKNLSSWIPGYFPTPFQSASVFGLHQAKETSADYTWATQDLANFQVYLVRDELESPTAKFILKRDYAGQFLFRNTRHINRFTQMNNGI